VARDFDDGSSQYLHQASALGITDFPFTMVCWFKSDDIATGQALMGLGEDAGDDYHMLYIDDDDVQSNLSVVGYTYAGGGAGEYTTTGVAANVWAHAAGVWASSTDRRSFLNGGGKNTSADNQGFATPDVFDIGAIDTSSGPTYNMSGKIAHAAIWNAALTDAEVAILAAGYSPLFVRPQSLVAYWPLLRTDKDIVGAYDMTAYNAPTWAADHPPIIMPAPIFYSFPSAVDVSPAVSKLDLTLTLLSETILASKTRVWGHDTAVDEDSAGDLGDGTTTADVSGSGDAEKAQFTSGEYWESPTEFIGTGAFTIELNKYQGESATGFTVKYKTGATQALAEAESWTEGTSFESTGWGKIRVEY
jgi:hypothetical protein